jgi:excisionase family DNA binding protein
MAFADFAFLALAPPRGRHRAAHRSQVAEALSASSQTIRNWIRAEHLRGVRIGNRFLIPRAEVERLRGDVAVSRGESPWAFDPDEPGAPLLRVGERVTDDSAESLLGG